MQSETSGTRTHGPTFYCSIQQTTTALVLMPMKNVPKPVFQSVFSSLTKAAVVVAAVVAVAAAVVVVDVVAAALNRSFKPSSIRLSHAKEKS